MSDQRPDHLTWRHRVLFGALILSIAVVVGRLWDVQVNDHERYLERAATSRFGAAQVTAPRGAIVDATGYPLATSIDTWDIYIDSFLWRDRDKASQAAIGLAGALNLDADSLYELGTSRDAGDIIVRRNLPYREGAALQEQGLWGVRALPNSVRVYPEGDLARPLLGDVGLEGTGLWGVEMDFDHVLRGRPGTVSLEQDPLGRPIAFAPRVERPASSGGEVQLTIDRFIQEIAERRLDEALADYQAPSGSIIVMNPRTGAILALASRPAPRVDVDPAELPDLVRNRPVTDLYEPGSVLKTVTTAMAIDLGLVSPGTTYEDRGVVEVGTYQIRNWNFQAYGVVTMTEYLQRSLNTGSVWLSELIGADDFYPYLERFGLGSPTHLGLSGEAEGMVRTPEDDDWYPVDLATNSYGQGLAVTPLQVLTAINVFANDGVLMRPYVVSRIVNKDEVREFEPVDVRQVIRPETARTVARMMYDVVEGVEHHGARVPGYHVAGKTGTTLVSIPTGYEFDTTIASFAGFLPYEDPQVSVLVKIDQPGGGRNLGGEVAAPVFSRVAADIMDYLSIPPDVVASP